MCRERQNQEARELEKQQKEREKERERAERERQEREKLERERQERQEREKMERERQERIEQERQERERLEKQRAAEQAVHKHFEESFRLAHQKVSTLYVMYCCAEVAIQKEREILSVMCEVCDFIVLVLLRYYTTLIIDHFVLFINLHRYEVWNFSFSLYIIICVINVFMITLCQQQIYRIE